MWRYHDVNGLLFLARAWAFLTALLSSLHQQSSFCEVLTIGAFVGAFFLATIRFAKPWLCDFSWLLTLSTLFESHPLPTKLFLNPTLGLSANASTQMEQVMHIITYHHIYSDLWKKCQILLQREYDVYMTLTQLALSASMFYGFWLVNPFKIQRDRPSFSANPWLRSNSPACAETCALES